MITREELLIDACDIGALEVVKVLVEKGADIHVDDDLPLFASSKNGHLEVVKYLVEQGADIHVNNNCHLFWAKINNHTSVVEYLESVMEKV